jgi:dihydrolipoamide dehydrogenase
MDLVVIGSGPAGYYAALRANSLGANTILIERENLGGTCVNVGCIPSKMLLSFSHMKNGERFKPWAELRKDVKKMVKILRLGMEVTLKEKGIQLIKGEARLSKDKVITNGETIKYDKLIVATGTLPWKFSNFVKVSDEVYDLEEMPRKVAILGGGAGVIEFADIFQGLGSEVHLFESSDMLLKGADKDIRSLVTSIYERKGINLHLSEKFNEVREREGRVTLITDKGAYADFDLVLVSFGRKPCLKGLESRFDGWIKVNEFQETGLENVYAAGDITGTFTAHEAIRQGIVASENSFGFKSKFKPFAVPKVIYSQPEIAQVGYSEEKVKEIGLGYISFKYPFSSIARAHAEDKKEGIIKVILDKEGYYLGVHVVGERAEEIAFIASIAMEKGLKAEEITSFSFPHPSFVEILWEATSKAIRKL